MSWCQKKLSQQPFTCKQGKAKDHAAPAKARKAARIVAPAPSLYAENRGQILV